MSIESDPRQAFFLDIYIRNKPFDFTAELKKRSLSIKNLPDNVEVDTLKALFPEAVSVKLIIFKDKVQR